MEDQKPDASSPENEDKKPQNAADKSAQANAAANAAGPRPLQTLVLLAIVLGVLAVVWIFISSAGKKALDEQLVQWQEAGGKTELAELAPPLPPQEENAAVVYIRAFKSLPPLNAAQVSVLGDPWGAPVPALAQVLGMCAQPLKLAHEAAELPACRWPTDYSDMDELEAGRDQVVRFAGQLATTISADAILKLRQENPTGAVTSLLDGFALGDDLGNDPFLANFVENIRIHRLMLDVMERGFSKQDVPSADVLAQVLAAKHYRDRLPQVLMAEGTFTISVYRSEEFRERLAASLVATKRDIPWWYVSAMTGKDMAHYLDMLRQDAQRLGQPYHTQDHTQGEPTHPGWAVLAYISPAMLPQLNEFVASAEAKTRMAIIALKLRAHKAEHGAYPQTLAALGEIPVDPFTGEAFKYQTREEGFVLGSPGSAEVPAPTWYWAK